VESDGVGILSRKRRIGNVASDLDLGNDTTLTDVHGSDVGDLSIISADAAVVLDVISSVGGFVQRNTEIVRSKVHGEPLVGVGEIEPAGGAILFLQKGGGDEEIVANHVLAASVPLVLKG
jgi:hypothetical protein